MQRTPRGTCKMQGTARRRRCRRVFSALPLMRLLRTWPAARLRSVPRSASEKTGHLSQREAPHHRPARLLGCCRLGRPAARRPLRVAAPNGLHHALVSHDLAHRGRQRAPRGRRLQPLEARDGVQRRLQRQLRDVRARGAVHAATRREAQPWARARERARPAARAVAATRRRTP